MSYQRLLVTGGAGFIGSNFVHYMLEQDKNVKITILDKLTYAGNLANLADLPDDRLTFIKGDICNQTLVNRLVSQADAVINFAAESHNDNSLENPKPFLDTNIIGTYTLLEAVRQYQVRYHHVSTDEVFGDLPLDSKEQFHKESPYKPSSPYSATKASSDLLVRAWVRSFGIQATISSSSNNYGPYQHIEKLIPRTISTILSGEKPKIFGDGRQIRDWLHVSDHVSGLAKVLEKGKIGETYLFSANEEHSNLTIVQDILQIVQKSSDDFQFVSDRVGQDQRYALDASETNRELSWQPEHCNFQQGLEETVNWYRDNQSWWESQRLAVEKRYQKMNK